MPPLPGKRWYHVTFSTRNSWLPGDERGFRSKQHKLHSSGDHRNPPPKGEHAGLHRHAKSISGNAVILDQAARRIVGRAIVDYLTKHQHEALVIAVGGMHVHMLVQLPENLRDAKRAIGNVKLSASMRLKDKLPGRVWAGGCKLTPIRDERHHRNTFAYIQRHIGEGAWVWTFRDGGVELGGGDGEDFEEKEFEDGP